MEISIESIWKNKLTIISFLEFKEKFHPEITMPAIRQAAIRGDIDIIKFGKINCIVLTRNTLSYKPIKYKSRV